MSFALPREARLRAVVMVGSRDRGLREGLRLRDRHKPREVAK